MEKELLKKVRRHRRIVYVAGIVFLMMGIGIGMAVQSIADVDQLYRENKVYGISDSNTVAMKVYVIYWVGSQEDTNKEIYFVQHEHGYAALLAKSNEEVIQPLLKTWNSEGVLLRVEQVDIPGYTEQVLRQVNKDSTYIAPEINFQKVAILRSDSEDENTLFWSAIVLGVLGALSLIAVVSRGHFDRKALETLYVEYPELRNNLDLLNTNASYSDDFLGVRVYKKNLILLRGALNVIDLTTIDWSHYLVIAHRGQRTYQLFFRSYLHKDRVVSLVFNRKENPEVNIQALYNYLSGVYPDMLIGPSKKAIFKERQKAQRESYR